MKQAISEPHPAKPEPDSTTAARCVLDKFQGREAAVVFYSMATSSAEDVPRSLEFLFSRNRLNVAVSRARCLACIVASPRLLESRARTVEQMRLINALCRFVELAEIDLSTTWHIDENPLGYYAAAVSDTLRTIAALVQRGEVRISAHGYDEMAEDGILAGEAIDGVMDAVVVED